MSNYEFKRSNRKCSATGRDFEPGEEYISALIEVDEDLERSDFALDQWGEPPEGCLAWWRSQVPDLTKGRVYWAPRNVLLSYFDHLNEGRRELDVLFVMSLLLVRKKILRLLDTIEFEAGEAMVLMDPGRKQKYEIPVVQVASARQREIQDELAAKLFTDHQCLEDETQSTSE